MGGEHGAETYTRDHNNDGVVDSIGFINNNLYSVDSKGSNNPDAKLMTPEIRAKVSELMNDSRELSRMLLEETWRQVESQKAN